ncbi:methyl-accepting chemotaxis protein McpC (plasmid) [Peptoclostridium acidaminophilum DSM 3953]|uniref:Methyl-accepting chemotaxis protein McpC n=1 Tax=Peptoclostridium acidaminophilum DSM 3953 TaxID=1286171 RepID=W8TMY4_PEPAC|nr:methyl-accepting chemotaxis protein [Peptoclostridium acidaminophilum]AHM57552.1 methyl-accepting chemotaxis protein McpC [Peptoclostridium acidaminophilum DSM 3953]
MLNNIKMKNKLLIFASTMIAFILTVGALGYFYIAQGSKDMSSMFNDNLTPIVHLENSKLHAKSIETSMLSLLYNFDTLSPSQVDESIDNIQLYSENLSSDMALYEKSRLDDFETKTLSEFKKARSEYVESLNKVLELAKAGDKAGAADLFRAKKEQLAKYQDYLEELTKYNVEAAADVDRQNDIESANAAKITAAAIALALVCAAALTYLITISITRPLTVANLQLKTIADGDLSTSIPEKYTAFKDEIGEMSRSIEHMQDSLKNLLSSVKSSSDTIKESSQTLHTITTESSEAINCVANAMEEVASGSMTQAKNSDIITGMAHELGNKIAHADILASDMIELSQKTSELSQKGMQIVGMLDSKMAENMKVSKEINVEVNDMYNYLKTIEQTVILIDKIANQTNLLSLNASIEAARAGEMGMGFAIVADEIRKLSEETERAAKDIKEMVSTIEDKAQSVVSTMENVESIVVQQGNAVSSTKEVFIDTAELIAAVVASVEQVKEHTRDVNENKEQIIVAIDQISSLIQETTAATQETSASMEEQAAAMEEVENHTGELGSIAQLLQEDVNKFRM